MSSANKENANFRSNGLYFVQTWCAVERKKEEDWCRKNRRHYKDHLKSVIFDNNEKSQLDPKWKMWAQNENKHFESKHFPERG